MATVTEPKIDIDAVCAELQRLQRRRSMCIRSRIMIENRAVAIVAAVEFNYRAGLEKQERDKLWDAAKALVEELWKQAQPLIKEQKPWGHLHELIGMVIPMRASAEGLNGEITTLEKMMLKLAAKLPTAKIVETRDMRGFSLLSLATLVGEAGNLDNYANPGKLWRRMGCAPFTSQGKTLMGSTWRMSKEGQLTKDEWTQYGYSPRRRSISYVMGENIVKQNMETEKMSREEKKALKAKGLKPEIVWTGKYRKRYEQAKARAAERHPEWISEKNRKDGTLGARCHRHGMLLATKMLIRDIWVEWTGNGPSEQYDWRQSATGSNGQSFHGNGKA